MADLMDDGYYSGYAVPASIEDEAWNDADVTPKLPRGTVDQGWRRPRARRRAYGMGCSPSGRPMGLGASLLDWIRGGESALNTGIALATGQNLNPMPQPVMPVSNGPDMTTILLLGGGALALLLLLKKKKA